MDQTYPHNSVARAHENDDGASRLLVHRADAIAVSNSARPPFYAHDNGSSF